MVIVYLSRMTNKNADVSYNTAWGGIWVFVEISFGITVTGMLFLPKFIEAEGTKLWGVFSSLTRPVTSLTSGKKDTTASQEVTLDTIAMIGDSRSDVVSINRDQDVERYPFYEGGDASA